MWTIHLLWKSLLINFLFQQHIEGSNRTWTCWSFTNRWKAESEKALATTKIFCLILLLREPSSTNPFSDLCTIHLWEFDFIAPWACQQSRSFYTARSNTLKCQTHEAQAKSTYYTVCGWLTGTYIYLTIKWEGRQVLPLPWVCVWGWMHVWFYY